MNNCYCPKHCWSTFRTFVFLDSFDFLVKFYQSTRVFMCHISVSRGNQNSHINKKGNISPWIHTMFLSWKSKLWSIKWQGSKEFCKKYQPNDLLVSAKFCTHTWARWKVTVLHHCQKWLTSKCKAGKTVKRLNYAFRKRREDPHLKFWYVPDSPPLKLNPDENINFKRKM